MAIFGQWPSFHDAEVLQFNFDRKALDDGFGPTLEALIHVFEMTSEIGGDGYFVLRNHVLVQMRFHDIDVLLLEGFNHQNVLFGLEILDLHERQLDHLRFEVTFSAAFGMHANFQCHAIEVIDVTPCDKNGKPQAELT